MVIVSKIWSRIDRVARDSGCGKIQRQGLWVVLAMHTLHPHGDATIVSVKNPKTYTAVRACTRSRGRQSHIGTHPLDPAPHVIAPWTYTTIPTCE